MVKIKGQIEQIGTGRKTDCLMIKARNPQGRRHWWSELPYLGVFFGYRQLGRIDVPVGHGLNEFDNIEIEVRKVQ